jgi:hypothetical protein
MSNINTINNSKEVTYKAKRKTAYQKAIPVLPIARKRHQQISQQIEHCP